MSAQVERVSVRTADGRDAATGKKGGAGSVQQQGMSNPWAALGSSGSDSEDGSDGSDGSDPQPHPRPRPRPQPEPEPEPAAGRVQTAEELEDEMELRYASDDEGEMSRSSAAATSKKNLKKLRKEQRRAARHAQSRPAAGALEASAESANESDDDDGGGGGGGCGGDGSLSVGRFRSQHRIKLYSWGDSVADPPQFAPVQTFQELAGRQMAGGIAIEAALVDACVSTIGGGSGSDVRPSPVQAECWGALLSGAAADLVATSYTGSGKTLAFLLPAFAAFAAAQQLPHGQASPTGSTDAAADQELQDPAPRPVAPQGLVLAPTRELCQQIAAVADRICAYLKEQQQQQEQEQLQEAAGHSAAVAPRVSCVVGGVDYVTQREQLLSTKPAFIAATPGRLVALCGCVPASTRARQVAAASSAGLPPPDLEDEERKAASETIISLECVRTLVLDEADRMLDLGFAEDIATISTLIATRAGERFPFLSAAVHPSTWMFSATWPQAAELLAQQLLLPGATHIAIGSQQEDMGPDGETSGQKLVTAATVQQRFERMHGNLYDARDSPEQYL
jgi:hypothetical protein